MITGDDLTNAALGHIDATPQTEEAIATNFRGADIDPDEAHALLKTLMDLREVVPEDRGFYGAGLIDGLLLGVKAARAEAARED